MLLNDATLRAGGAVAGHGLGSLLGLPREALTNLLVSPWAQDDVWAANHGSDEANPFWKSLALVPGALGAGAGLLALSNPMTAPLALLAGAGVGGLAQGAMKALTPDGTVDAPTGGELATSLGADADSLGGKTLGFGLDMATDPLTYLGIGGGGAVSGAREAMVGRAAQAEQEVRQLERLRDLTVPAAKAYQEPINTPLTQLLAEGAKAPLSYRPDVIDALPDVVGSLGRTGGQSKLYKQVEPGLAQDLDLVGLSQPHAGPGVALTLGEAPPFATSRGGWLKPSAARQEMLAGGEPLAHPAVVGPRLDRDLGYMGTLDDPMQTLRHLRSGTGLGDLPSPAGATAAHVPTLAELMGGEALDSARALRAGQVPMPTGGIGHVVDLPAPAGRDLVEQLLQQARAHQETAHLPQGALEQVLSRLGLAGRL